MASTTIGLAFEASIIHRLGQVNWLVVGLLGLLGLIGAAMLYSVAGGNFEPWAGRHLTRLIAGLALVLVLAVVPLRFWLSLAYPAYIVTLAAVILVPLLGSEALGARRWLRLGEFSLQPSEMMKLALVLALARYYQTLAPSEVSRPLRVLVPLLLIAIPVGLVLRQPDLGTAAVFAVVGLTTMFLAGVHVFYFLGAGAAAALLAPTVWGLLHGYQRQRILTFLDPDRDPLGAGYHIIQSKISLGAGGLFGKGFMHGTQGRLQFLPEMHTDFIFPMLAEETGFLGAALVIVLYGALVVLLLRMALACRSQFGRLLVAGAAVTLFVHASVNIAMVTGLVPVVGIPLPLLSYGGTAMLTLMASMGVAVCAGVNREERLKPSRF